MDGDTNPAGPPEGDTRPLSIAEVAMILGDSEAYVRELIDLGALTGIPAGGELRIPSDGLADFCAERAQRKKHLREIGRITDASPGGWED